MYLNVSLSISYIPIFLISCPHFYLPSVSTIAERRLCFAYWKSSDMAWTSDNLHRLSELICRKPAFDSISHELLLAKSSAYGINSCSCLLFENYLTDRLQRVMLGINSPIGVFLLGEYHKDQYWVLYYLTSILMTYFSLVFHPKSVHMLMIPRSPRLVMIPH